MTRQRIAILGGELSGAMAAASLRFYLPIQNIEIIYDVPYISHDINHQMVKIGIQFDFNEKIKAKTDMLLGENWENFIDAESIEKLLDS